MIKVNDDIDIINAAYIRLLFTLLATAKSKQQYDALIDYYVFDNEEQSNKYINLNKTELRRLSFNF